MKGPHGALLPNPNGGKRRVRERVYGTVVKAVGQHKWEVTFDFDGVAKEVTSKSLQLATEGAGIPVDELTSSEAARDAVSLQPQWVLLSIFVTIFANTTVLCCCCCCCCCQSPAIVSTTGSSERSSENTRDTTDTISTADVADAIEAAVDPSVLDALEEQEDNVEGGQEDELGPEDIQVPGGVSMPSEATGDDEEIPNNDFCFTHNDFIEYQSSMNDATRHQNTHAAAWNEIKSMVGEEITVKSAKDGNIKWRVVECVRDDDMREIIEREQNEYDKKVGMMKNDYSTLASAFWDAWPVEIPSELIKINIAIDIENVKRKERYQRVIKHVSTKEFKYFNALMIGATVHGKQGTELWIKTNGVTKKKTNFLRSSRFRRVYERVAFQRNQTVCAPSNGR